MKLPFGYVPKIDSADAKIVKRIFDLCIDKRWSVNKIAEEVSTAKRTFTPSMVQYVLLNPAYCGKGYPAIISEERFKQAGDVLYKKATGKLPSSSSRYLFSGVLKCGKCGANFKGGGVTRKPTGEFRNYRCSNYCGNKGISEMKVMDHLGMVYEPDVYKQKIKIQDTYKSIAVIEGKIEVVKWSM